MPVDAPSPHRFLAAAPPSTQKAKRKPQSSLRNGVSAQTTRSALTPRQAFTAVKGETRTAPAKRFVFAPSRPASIAVERGRDNEGIGEDKAWAHTQNAPRPRPPGLGRVESIDESSPSSSAGAQKGRDDAGVLQSIEQPEHVRMEPGDSEKAEDEEEEILFVSEAQYKRRRVSPPPHALPPPSSDQWSGECVGQLRPPQTPAPASHRFRIPAPKTSAVFDNASASLSDPAPAPTTGQGSNRPHFILPDSSPSPTKSAMPLPEIFSPSRKTGKYIPGGLASTLQSWVIETADTGYSAQNANSVVWGRDKEDGVRVKLRITSISGGRVAHDYDGTGEVECYPGSCVFVRGVTEATLYNASRAPDVPRLEDGRGEFSVMLAGQGSAKGKGGIRVREGSVVGIRAPFWEIDVGDEGRRDTGEQQWIVGVEWVVLR